MHPYFLKEKSMILPNEWIKECAETYLYETEPKSPIIYRVILVSTIVTILALPFIYVDISVQENGIIRPIIEKTEIKSRLTGVIDTIYIHEGKQIKEGDTLLCFKDENVAYNISYQQNKLNDYKAQLIDLNLLAKRQIPDNFSSYIRQQEYICFKKKKEEMETRLRYTEKEYARNKRLFETKVISEEEYDSSFFNYQNLQNELASFIESQLSIWQSDLNMYLHLYDETNTALKQNLEEKELYAVKSPINGTVDDFSGIYKGSNVQAGELLAVISPDSTLCLEVNVSPKNIGYLYTGMPVQIRIEAFNYNEWGSIGGKVKEISSDFLTDNHGNAFYKIKCGIKQNYLTLKNGRMGVLKKGMTANVHFMIAKRSLFDLLYRNMDIWINPSQNFNKTK